ncbi:MAG: hypothetical protein DMF37_11565, partial [Verrucomicrobia bacterium]
WAARSSFFPTLVSRDAFANAVTWNNSVFQIGSVVGPALSGLLVAYIGFPFVYLLDALCAFLFFLLVFPIRRSTQKREQTEESTWKSLVAGVRFVFRRKVILATITLDLFAVLLGGATALMRRFRDGADCGAPASDETGRPSLNVVRHGIWHRDDSFRTIQNILVIFWLVISSRRVRQRERDHPRVDRPTRHPG